MAITGCIIFVKLLDKCMNASMRRQISPCGKTVQEM
jgi:hypothetical protein